MSRRRTDRENEIRREVLTRLFDERADPYLNRVLCEIQWGVGCHGFASQGHEPLTRGRGGSITDPRNIVLTCPWCHRQVHLNPEEATRRGWLVHSWASTS